jgi:MFS transporter, ACS family, hexuronate transporter
VVASTAASRYFVLGILTLTQTGTSLISQGIGTLAPFIAPALALDRTHIGMLAAGIGLTWALTGSFAGVIVDRFGERRVIFMSGVGMGAAIGLSAAIKNYWWLLAWFAVYGIMSSFSTPAGGRAIILWFRRGRALAMGIRQSGVPIGGFVGALLLPPLAAHWGYRVSLVVAGILIMATAALVAFVYARPEGASVEPQRFRSLWRQSRTIARDPRFVMISVTLVIHVAAQMSSVSFLSISLINLAHMSIPAAVAAIALFQGGAIAGRFVWGVVSDKLLDGDRMLPAAIACVIAVGAELVLAARYPAATLSVAALLYTCSFGLGFSIAGCNGLFAVAQTEVAGPDNAASALGVSSSRISWATVVAPPIFGLLADTHGYSIAWLTLCGLTALGVFPALAARRLIGAGPRAA